MGFEPTASGATIQRSKQRSTSATIQVFKLYPHYICTQDGKIAILNDNERTKMAPEIGWLSRAPGETGASLRQAAYVPRLAIVTDVENPVIETYMRLKQRYGAGYFD